MLVLPSLHALLAQAIPPPGARTKSPRIAALLTPGAGALVALASAPGVPRDDARVLCALAAEVWTQTGTGEDADADADKEGDALAESQFGRVLVRPVPDDGAPPVMLLALAGSEKADWQDLRVRARELARHLTPAIAPLREKLAPRAPPATEVKKK